MNKVILSRNELLVYSSIKFKPFFIPSLSNEIGGNCTFIRDLFQKISNDYQIKRVAIPYYMCQEVSGSLERKFSIIYYPVDHHLMPDRKAVLDLYHNKKVCAFIFVDYFGSDSIDYHLIDEIGKHSYILIDRAHSIPDFARDINLNAFTLYSLRKQLPYSFGKNAAIMVSAKQDKLTKKGNMPSFSLKLLSSIFKETLTNKFYREIVYYDNDPDELDWGESLLNDLHYFIDWKIIFKMRKSNSENLLQSLFNYGVKSLDIGKSTPTFAIPLYVKNAQAKLYNFHKVGIDAYQWPATLPISFETSNKNVAQYYKNNVVFLPITSKPLITSAKANKIAEVICNIL